MRNYTNWGKISFLSLVLAASAMADHHEMGGKNKMSGHITAGYSNGLTNVGAGKGSQFLVDSVHIKKHFAISEHTSVHLHNAMAINDGNTAFFGRSLNEAGYFSAATLGAANLRFSNLAAFIDFECGDGLHVKVGHMKNPLGLESIGERAGMHGYYYSHAYNASQALGWVYNLGLGVTYSSDSAGTLDLNLFQNRLAAAPNTDTTMGAALRYHMNMDGGDWSFMPVLSGYFGRFHGGPEDLGFTAGGKFKMGTIWANLEFVYTSTAAVLNGAKTKNYSIYLEPGFDLGMASISLKPEYAKLDGGGQDFNLSAVISKAWGSSWMKLAYLHTGSQGVTLDPTGAALGANGNELRVLFGTDW